MKTDAMLSYQTIVPLSASLAGEQLTYFSKPGLPNWDQVTPSQQLLAERVNLFAGEKLLFLGCHVGAAALSLARRFPDCQLMLADENWTALNLSNQNLQQYRLENTTVGSILEVLPAGQQAFDVVLLDLPKGRQLAQRWLAIAIQALRPGGQLFLAGQKNQGILSLAQDVAQLLGEPITLAYRKGNRLLRFRRPESLLQTAGWWTASGVQPGSWYEFTAALPSGEALSLVSLPGIFSYDRLDDGTQRLLEQIRLTPGDRVLDLGCGYGVIGLAVARLGIQAIDLVDVNLAAIAATRENAQRLELSQVRIFPSDVLSAVRQESYSCILTNPPFHAGHQVDRQLSQAFVVESWQALQPGGQLWLVANRFLGYEKMAREYFPSVEIISQDNRYYVLRAVK